MVVDNLDGDIRLVSCLSVDAAMCVEGIIGMVRYIKKKRVETSRRGVAMGDIEKEIHILAEMENENIIYLHQVPQKSHSSLGCPKKTKSPNFVSQITPVVFIG